MWRDRKFFHATAVLVGAMVGAGIYGIPFAFARAGFLTGLAWLIGVAVVVCLADLLFAELTLVTPGTHQMSGYVGAWLGAWGRHAMTIAVTLGAYGALLAYLILFGDFAHTVLSPFLAVDPWWYSIVFALGWSFVWFARIRTIAAVEFGLVALYTLAVAAIVALGIGDVRPSNLTGWASSAWFLPYGVVLFAFGGAAAIPIQRQLLAGRERLLRPAVLMGMAFVTLLYGVFAAIVVGISGGATSPEALAGLVGRASPIVVVVGSLLGMLTVSTTYVALGTALWETYRFDYRLRPSTAWLLTLSPALILFLSGLRNFIEVIAFVGAIAGGLQMVLLMTAYLRARRKHAMVAGLLIAFAGAGMLYTLIAQ